MRFFCNHSTWIWTSSPHKFVFIWDRFILIEFFGYDCVFPRALSHEVDRTIYKRQISNKFPHDSRKTCENLANFIERIGKHCEKCCRNPYRKSFSSAKGCQETCFMSIEIICMFSVFLCKGQSQCQSQEIARCEGFPLENYGEQLK